MKRIMIVGPTASGKTELAHRLALEMNGEIISADSRQCYKRIDIGTAKPELRLLQEISYYNISILDLDEQDSVSSFLHRAGQWEHEIIERGKRVIYAGGSTLHLEGLIRPLDDLPASDRGNLALLQSKADVEGLEALYDMLKEADPDYAAGMDGLNRQRIMRALDVWLQTGRPFSSFHQNLPLAPPDDLLVYGLYRLPRTNLYRRINKRADHMLDEGLVEETRRILADGFSQNLQSLQTAGYRDVVKYLNKSTSYDQMAENMKTGTRRYAKRQITWFRRWPFMKWLNAETMPVENMTDMIKQDLAADMNKG